MVTERHLKIASTDAIVLRKCIAGTGRQHVDEEGKSTYSLGLASTYLERIVDTYGGLVFRRCQSKVASKDAIAQRQCIAGNGGQHVDEEDVGVGSVTTARARVANAEMKPQVVRTKPAE